MDDDLYWEVLEAVEVVLGGVAALAPYKIDIRPAPTYVRDEDGAQITLVCPRRETWEMVNQLTMNGDAHLDYPVLVALVIANAFDRDQFRWQVHARRDVRRALWNPGAIDVTGIYDVNYDPAPSGVALSAFSPAAAVSLQLFTFRSGEVRAT